MNQRTTSRTPVRASLDIADGRLTRGQLWNRYTRVFPDVWLEGREPPRPLELARAAWCWSDGAGVLAGWSAAAVHGARWLPDDGVAEIVMPARSAPVDGPRTWRWRLEAGEVVEVRGVRATSLTRTAFDLARRLPLPEAVAALDHLCALADVAPTDILVHDRLHPGGRGAKQLRRVVELADTGAESPWESRTRVAVVLGGLPRPRTQIRVRTEQGCIVARLDMGWEKWKVALEYDGDHHRDPDQFRADIARRAELVTLGWTPISATAADVSRGAPRTIAAARAALRRAGAPV